MDHKKLSEKFYSSYVGWFVKKFIKFIKFILHIGLSFIEFFSSLRVKIAPTLFVKIEQFLYESGIEVMQKHVGYAAFSEMLRSHIPAGAYVLDLGCNKGFETSIIAKTNPVMGADLFSSFVKKAKKRGLDAEVADFHNLPYFEKFDCVYSNNSLEHSRYPDRFINGVYRALKKGGIFIIGMPLDGYNLLAKDPAHFFRAKKEDVISLLQKENFKVTYEEIVNTKEKWNWDVPPSCNQMLICVAQK